MVDTKVIIKNRTLEGSTTSNTLQRVASVYVNGTEYRILAPTDARGDVLEWMSHLSVRNLVDPLSEVEVYGAIRGHVLAALEEDLKRKEVTSHHAESGMHPDGVHCSAQICTKGHVQHFDGMPFEVKAYCKQCGSACISECRHCKEPIQGIMKYRAAYYSRPQYCHHCGQAYPWMEDTLSTVRELLNHDDKLSPEEKDKLLGEFRDYVSDPKSEKAAVKKKLFDIKLDRATAWVREAILDLTAKTIAESLKP